MRDLSFWNNHPFKHLLDLQREFEETATPWFTPPCDVEESDAGFELSLDLPGVKKDDLTIELTGRELTITGRRERRPAKGDTPASYTQFRRSFSLPDGTDRERIEAKHENGVLNLRIPKAEEAKPRQIRVA